MKTMLCSLMLGGFMLVMGCTTVGCADLGRNWWSVEPPLDNVPSNTITNAPLQEVPQ